MLPHDLPPWKTVYHYFRGWRIDETMEKLNAVLRTEVRVQAGGYPQPSAAIIDSQSIKTTPVAGDMTGGSELMAESAIFWSM